jgi:23S rRNA (uracil1939-C5)-methyltransferase
MKASDPQGRWLRVGDRLSSLQVTALDAGGLGVAATLSGAPVLIAGAAPGDDVAARVVHVSGHAPFTAWAEVTGVNARADAFTQPTCHHAAPLRGRCGGCPLMHLTPSAQADWKRERVQGSLPAAPSLPGADASDAPITATFEAAPSPWGYRNRAHYVAGRTAHGRAILGAYAPRSHVVVPQSGCRVVHPLIDATANGLIDTLRALSIPIHPEPGAVRYVTLRVAPSTSPDTSTDTDTDTDAPDPQCIVEWICADVTAPWLPALIDATCALPGVAGAGASLNATDGNTLHAAPPTLWRGLRALTEFIGALPLDLTTDAFAQLNSAVATRMYARAAALIPDGAAPDCIWDLYCGTGALGVTAALRHRTQTLCGAEMNPSALTTARALAAAQGIHDARYKTLDLGHQPTPPDWPTPQAILINPPRQGIDPALLPHIIASPARHLIYMSCSPPTLQRDLAALIASGSWRVTSAEAHDMLPQTAHVEALISLSRCD